MVKCKGCGLLYVKNRPNDNEISDAHKKGQHSGEKEFNVTGTYNTGKEKFFSNVLDDFFDKKFFKAEKNGLI